MEIKMKRLYVVFLVVILLCGCSKKANQNEVISNMDSDGVIQEENTHDKISEDNDMADEIRFSQEEVSTKSEKEEDDSQEVSKDIKRTEVFCDSEKIVTYEKTNIDYYNGRQSELITKIITSDEVIDIEYGCDMAQIKLYPEKILVNGNLFEYKIRDYFNYDWVKSFCLGFTYNNEYYDFLTDSDKDSIYITGISKNGEPIAYYKYEDIGDSRYKKLTGVYKRDDDGNWQFCSDPDFIGNKNNVRGDAASNMLIYSDKIDWYYDISHASMFGSQTDENGRLKEYKVNSSIVNITNELLADRMGNEKIIMIDNPGVPLYSQEYFDLQLVKKYSEFKAENPDREYLKPSVSYSEWYDTYRSYYRDTKPLVEFAVEYMFEGAGVTVKHDNEFIWLYYDGESYRYDMKKSYRRPIQPDICQVYFEDVNADGKDELVIQDGDEILQVIDVGFHTDIKSDDEQTKATEKQFKFSYDCSVYPQYQEIIDYIRDEMVKDNFSFKTLTDAGISSAIYYAKDYIGIENKKDIFGYALADLDMDGIDELLLGQESDFEEWNGKIYNIYTIKEGELQLLATGTERSPYYLSKDGMICLTSSGGASFSTYKYYEMKNGELNLKEAVIYYGAHVEDGCPIPSYYGTEELENMSDCVERYSEISHESADKILAKYEKYNIPFAQFME